MEEALSVLNSELSAPLWSLQIGPGKFLFTKTYLAGIFTFRTFFNNLVIVDILFRVHRTLLGRNLLFQRFRNCIFWDLL